MSDKVTALFPGSAAANAERPVSSMLREWADVMMTTAMLEIAKHELLSR